MRGYSRDPEAEVNRRRFLKTTGAGAIAIGAAGCTSGDETPTETPGDEDTPEPTDTETETTPETSGEPTQGGTFTYGMAHKPDTANRTQASSVYTSVALNLVYDGPIASDPSTYEPRPWIYSDWELTDTYENEDGEPVLEAHWNMRDDVEFGDGEPVTKEDILFSYDYIVENQIGQYSGLLGSVVTDEEGSPIVEEADNDWDFRGEFFQSYAWEFTTIGSLDILPKHVWEGKDPESYDPMEDDAVIGTGPGKLTKFDPDTAMQVEIVNDNYRDVLNSQDWVEEHDLLLAGGPFVDKFNFQVYGSDSAMTNAFMQGDVDTHYGSLAASRVEEANEATGRGIIEGLGSGFNYFGYNLRRAPLDDATLRQAMNFCWDNHFWVKTLQNDLVIDGDYPQTPGYPAGRPESYHDDAEMLTAPETELYNFRESSPGIADVEAIRDFLRNGQVADGNGGSYAGVDYPGTLFDDVEASQTGGSKYDYTFGPVESDVFEQAETDKEIRVDGQTIPEMMDGDAIEIITDPPSEKPRQIKAVRNWVTQMRRVGIPIRTQVLSFNTIVDRTAYTQDFDIVELGWGGTSAYGASNYYFFHSRWSTEGDENYDYNSTAYGVGDIGADDMLMDAYSTLDTDEAARKFSKTMERVYLDSPYRVWNYGKDQWPVNEEDWQGYVKGLVDPAYASWDTQANNVHQRE